MERVISKSKHSVLPGMQPSEANVPFEQGTSRLAIDVGNVIASQNIMGGDVMGRFTPSIECTKACRMLVDRFGPENTFILSKCKRQMQLATADSLSRPIDGKQSFLERTGLLARNVVFCTKRYGSDTSGGKPRLVPLYENDFAGPRVAVGNAGKGAVARTLRLTHMIDDRHDCLMSFFLEGHLAQQLLFGKRRQRQELEQQPDGSLLHFGSHSAVPSRERAIDFWNRHVQELRMGKAKNIDSVIAEACIEAWVAVQGWSEVLGYFHLDATKLLEDGEDTAEK